MFIERYSVFNHRYTLKCQTLEFSSLDARCFCWWIEFRSEVVCLLGGFDFFFMDLDRSGTYQQGFGFRLVVLLMKSKTGSMTNSLMLNWIGYQKLQGLYRCWPIFGQKWHLAGNHSTKDRPTKVQNDRRLKRQNWNLNLFEGWFVFQQAPEQNCAVTVFGNLINVMFRSRSKLISNEWMWHMLPLTSFSLGDLSFQKYSLEKWLGFSGKDFLKTKALVSGVICLMESGLDQVLWLVLIVP